MQVQEISHPTGPLLHPVFEWSFFSGHACMGILQVWIKGRFIFKDLQNSYEFHFNTVNKVLVKINVYGWGEPPCIDEVLQGAIDADQMFPTNTYSEAQRILSDLSHKWEKLIVRYTADREFLNMILRDVLIDL